MRNVPKLRFKEFNGDWEEKKLEEIGIIGRGKSKHRPRDDKKLFGGKYPFIQTGDIKNAGLFLNNYTQTYSDFGLEQSKLWKAGTLCITIAANIAETSILNINACFPDSIIGINVFNDKANNIFLKMYFDFKRKDFEKISEGLAQSNLNLDKLKSMFFKIPIIKEQEKIADFLSSVDKKISITEEKLDLFKEYKKGIMQKIFNQKLRFKDSEGNDYPEWEEKEVGELLVESKILPEKQELEKRITVKLNLKGIEKRKITPEEKEGATTNYLRKEGQFIYGKQNFHKGAFGIIPKELDGYQSSSDIPSFDFIRNLIIGKYFYYYFSQKNVYENLENISTGTGSKRIQPKVFFNVKLDIPCLEEQQKIANFLSSIDKKIDNLVTELEDLKEFKKGLLQQMFV